MAHNGRLRVAMIGAGNMANAVHYPSLASMSDVEFAGICDLDSERRPARAAAPNASPQDCGAWGHTR